MKLSISSHCIVLSVVQFTCLFLCHADSDSESIGSGSGDVPTGILTNTTAVDSITIEPTLTVPNLLVPFTTDIDQPPPSLSVYVIPQTSSFLSVSPSLLLPNTVFGPSTASSPQATSSTGLDISLSTPVSQHTPVSLHQASSVFPQVTASTSPPSSASPSPSSLPLLQYIVSLSRVVVIDQQQLGSVLTHIKESLAGLLNIRTTDIINVNILTQQEITKRQSSSKISFSAIEFYIRDIHSSSVAQLQQKV